MDTSLLIRHRFDVEIPHGKIVEITLILKGESTWRLWHRFDVDISTWNRLSKMTKYRWVLHMDFSMLFRRQINLTSVLAVSILSFSNIFRYDILGEKFLLVTPQTQDVNWTYIRRSEDAQDVLWTSYVRLIYVLCLRGIWFPPNANPWQFIIKVFQWTHLCWFAIDSTSKFHMERSWKLHWFWKANLPGDYDIDSTWIFRRGIDFQKWRKIVEFSTWIFLCCFDVKST